MGLGVRLGSGILDGVGTTCVRVAVGELMTGGFVGRGVGELMTGDLVGIGVDVLIDPDGRGCVGAVDVRGKTVGDVLASVGATG